MTLDIHKNKTFFFLGGFVSGVFWRSFFDFGIYFSVFVSIIALTFVLFYILTRKTQYFFVTLIVVGLALGILRFDIADFHKGDAYLNTRIGESVEVEGVVIGEPDRRENNTKLTLRLERAGERLSEEKILITTEHYPEYSYGDRLLLEGEIQKPKAFVGDDGRLFEYDAYLGKDDIFYLMFSPQITYIDGRNGNFIKQLLFDSKSAFLEKIENVIHEPEASLLGGLVVGAKQSLGEKLLDDFRRTGIIHIVVLSGYNVTIVAEFIMRTLSFLPLMFTWSLGIFAIVLFALMTGASATIVRASIMAILVIIARATGRTYQITRALLFAGFFMILHNPKILAFDSSFQLSFMATIGLIHLAPLLERYFGWLPTKWQLREFATATIATQLFVLPLLLYKMGDLSLVAFPVNLLVLPVVPLTMLSGFATGMVGFLNPLLSLPFAFITDAFLSYQLFVVGVFARLPFASISFDNFSLVAVITTYVIYGLMLFSFYKKTNNTHKVL